MLRIAWENAEHSPGVVLRWARGNASHCLGERFAFSWGVGNNVGNAATLRVAWENAEHSPGGADGSDEFGAAFQPVA